MVLKLLTAAYDDGWGFVMEADKLWLARPPYRTETVSATSEAALNRALLDPGFQAVDREFDGWAAVTEHLRAELRARRGGLLPPDQSPIEGLLPYASRDILLRYLERVERELIPARSCGPAQELLVSMLALEKVRNDAELYRRATGLLKQCAKALSTRQEAQFALAFDPDAIRNRYPYASSAKDPKQIAELARKIAQRKQIIRPAA